MSIEAEAPLVKVITITKCPECPHVHHVPHKHKYLCNKPKRMTRNPYAPGRVVPADSVDPRCLLP